MNWTAGLCVLSWNEAGEGLGKVQINLSPKGGMFNQELWGNPPPQQNRVELKVVAMFDHQRAQRVRVLLVRAFPHRLSHCKKLLWRRLLRKQNVEYLQDPLTTLSQTTREYIFSF